MATETEDAIRCHSYAEKHLREALKSLEKIVVNRCQGSEELGQDLNVLRDVFHKLLQVRDNAISMLDWEERG